MAKIKTKNFRALEEAKKQMEEMDNAVAGWFIGVFGFIFLSIVIGKLLVNYLK